VTFKGAISDIRPVLFEVPSRVYYHVPTVPPVYNDSPDLLQLFLFLLMMQKMVKRVIQNKEIELNLEAVSSIRCKKLY